MYLILILITSLVNLSSQSIEPKCRGCGCKNEVEELRKETFKELSSLLKEIENLKGDSMKKDRELKLNNEKLDKTVADLHFTNSKLSTTQDYVKSLQKDLSTVHQVTSSIQNELTTTKTQLVSTQNEVKSLKSTLSKAQLELVSVKGDLTAARADIAVANNKIATADDDVRKLTEGLNGYINAMKSIIVKIISDVSSSKTEIQNNNADIRNMKVVQNKFVSDVASVNNQLKKFLPEVSSVKNLIQKLQSSSVQLVNGKIPQPLLPGTYATTTLEDMGWQAIHMSAAAACMGTTPLQGIGTWKKLVMPVKVGETCEITCNRTSHKHCKSSVMFRGQLGKVSNYSQWAAEYKKYSCLRRAAATRGEVGAAENAIRHASIMYCCCGIHKSVS